MSNSKISALTASTTPLAGTETLPIVQSSTTKQVSVANLTAGRAVSASSLTASSGGVSVKGGPTGYGGDEIAMTTTASSYCAISTQMVGGTFFFDNRGTSNNVDWTFRNGSGGSNTLYNMGATGNITNYTGNYIPNTAAKGINFTANTPAAGKTSQLLNWYEEGTWTPSTAFATFVGAASSSGTYTRVGRQVTVNGTLTGATSVTVGASGILTTSLPFNASYDAIGSMAASTNTASGVVRVTGPYVVAVTTIAPVTSITFTATYFV